MFLISAVLIGILMVPLVLTKSALFFFLLTRFGLRARNALLSTLTLSNYSEFGLIVAAVGVANGWLDVQWLVVISVALSLSYLAAAPLTARDEKLYRRWRNFWGRFQGEGRLAEDPPLKTNDATIAIFGMGRVGAGFAAHAECIFKK